MSTHAASNNSPNLSSLQCASLDEILVTARLASGPQRLPKTANENKALHALAGMLATAPEAVPDAVLGLALELCKAGTAGLSLIEQTPTGDSIFRWTNLAGVLKGSRGSYTPRDFSPCGVALERKSAQLFSYPERRFHYFGAAGIPIVEALIVPLPDSLQGEDPAGTIWILSHGEHTHFDSEDLRILTVLASFAAVAQRMIEAESNLKKARANNEKWIRERTTELEQQIAERKRAADSLRELTGRLLHLRDEEQRRLARELHDSVGQLLTAISINISVVEAESTLLRKAKKAVSENSDLIAQISREIRTISHLLHPPLLDEVGLASGVIWYLEEFAERSNMKVELEMDDDFGRLPSELETTLFRIVQESLTNVHRHSESATARISVRRFSDEVILEVSDQGKGIPKDKIWELEAGGSIGVGVSGMRERVRQLGGKLEIRSEKKGTSVFARLPLNRENGDKQPLPAPLRKKSA